MNEQPLSGQAGSIWRDQPLMENISIDTLQRQTLSVSMRTRSEILVTLAAAVFLVIVLALRFYAISNRILLLGSALAATWIVVTLIRNRGRLSNSGRTADGTQAAEPWSTGLQFYRAELEGRRKHLASEWLWHGPLILACAVLIGLVAASMVPLTLARLLSVLPLLAALLIWIVFSVRQRRRQIAEIQREIEEISALTAPTSLG
jgi:hypothetical protein